MTLTLDLCWGVGAGERLTLRAVETSGAEGYSSGRQIEDRPPRRWSFTLPAEPHHRLLWHLRAFAREVKGTVVPFYITPPDDPTPVLVRFVGPLQLDLAGPGAGRASPEVEEAFGL